MKPTTGEVFATPGVLTLGDRQLVIHRPTPTDINRTHEEMRRLARADCVSPLQYVATHAANLDPGVLAEAIRSAVAMGSGGGVEPNRESVLRQYETVAGVSWRLWYQASRNDATLTKEWVASQITDENVYAVSDALSSAMGLGGDDKKKEEVPASGPNGS